MQHPGNGGLFRASFAPKGALHGRLHPHRDIARGDGLGPTQHTHQRIEQFVHWLIFDGFLRDLHLLAQRSKELEPTQILAQRTKTGPSTKVVETPNALRDSDWLYRNPEARADDLHWALENPKIRAIWATIGGNESVRILPLCQFGPHP